MVRSAQPIQLYRAQQPAKVVRPWSPVPVEVKPKADLIPAGLRGPRVQRRFTDKARFPRSPEVERQIFRSTTRLAMDDAGTFRSMDQSPRVFVRDAVIRQVKEWWSVAISVVGVLAIVAVSLFVMGPR